MLLSPQGRIRGVPRMAPPALRSCVSTKLHNRKDHIMDTTLITVFINSTLDVAWPLLPPEILAQLAWV